jgi:recombinase
MDPDQRIQEALKLVFRKFRELGSVRQVLLWLREERIELPAVLYQSGARRVVWKLPVYNTVLKILSNPVYAGAYAWGRTKRLPRLENGRKRLARGRRLAQQDWEVLIIEHHAGYIAWDEYQSNQAARSRITPT